MGCSNAYSTAGVDVKLSWDVNYNCFPHASVCLQLFLQGGPAARARHKKMLQLAKGYRGRANRCFVIARNRVEKALARAYTGRKLKKRDNRTLWITKINASARLHGINYSHVRLCVFCGWYVQELLFSQMGTGS